MVNLNLVIAFTSGVVSFFAPCVVPLLPAYISYVTGVGLNELRLNRKSKLRQVIVISSLLYILGFSMIFTFLGATAAGIGNLLKQQAMIIEKIGGVILIIYGLDFAGVLPIKFLAYEKKINLPLWASVGYLRPLALGIIFGLAWTPCVGVVLGSILVLAAGAGTLKEGALMLFVYSLGISIPFLIISTSLASAEKYIKWISKNIRVISMVAGLLLSVVGVLLLTDTYRYLNAWLFEIAFRFGYQIR